MSISAGVLLSNVAVAGFIVVPVSSVASIEFAVELWLMAKRSPVDVVIGDVNDEGGVSEVLALISVNVSPGFNTARFSKESKTKFA